MGILLLLSDLLLKRSVLSLPGTFIFLRALLFAFHGFLVYSFSFCFRVIPFYLYSLSALFLVITMTRFCGLVEYWQP